PTPAARSRSAVSTPRPRSVRTGTAPMRPAGPGRSAVSAPGWESPGAAANFRAARGHSAARERSAADPGPRPTAPGNSGADPGRSVAADLPGADPDYSAAFPRVAALMSGGRGVVVLPTPA